jgi:hypothetical protein
MITDDIDTLRGQFLATVVADNPSLVVIYDNQPTVEPPVDEVWCRFVVRPGAKIVAEGGSTPRYKQLGTIILQIVVPPEFGDTVGYELAEQADAAFANWRSADRAVTVYETNYRTIPARNAGEEFTINYSAYWYSYR